jgi:hypothetical protein
MNKQFCLSVAMLVLGLSACNDDALPTGTERDLLRDATHAPDLGGSAYGSASQILSGGTATPDTVRSYPPVGPWKPGSDRPPGTVLTHENDKTTGNYTQMVKPTGWEHIADEYNRSNYKPAGTEHISDGANKSSYKPANWVHFGGPPAIDKTNYIPSGYVHVKSGPNQSKYSKPVSTTPADTVPSGSGEEPVGN